MTLLDLDSAKTFLFFLGLGSVSHPEYECLFFLLLNPSGRLDV